MILHVKSILPHLESKILILRAEIWTWSKIRGSFRNQRSKNDYFEAKPMLLISRMKFSFWCLNQGWVRKVGVLHRILAFSQHLTIKQYNKSLQNKVIPQLSWNFRYTIRFLILIPPSSMKTGFLTERKQEKGELSDFWTASRNSLLAPLANSNILCTLRFSLIYNFDTSCTIGQKIFQNLKNNEFLVFASLGTKSWKEQKTSSYFIVNHHQLLDRHYYPN